MAKKNIANLYDPPKSKTQFIEGHKSKGILDDFSVRSSVETNMVRVSPFGDNIALNVSLPSSEATGLNIISTGDSGNSITLPMNSNTHFPAIKWRDTSNQTVFFMGAHDIHNHFSIYSTNTAKDDEVKRIDIPFNIDEAEIHFKNSNVTVAADGTTSTGGDLTVEGNTVTLGSAVIGQAALDANVGFQVENNITTHSRFSTPDDNNNRIDFTVGAETVIKLVNTTPHQWRFGVRSNNDFFIRDAQNSLNPFTIEAGAPSSSIEVKTTTGYVGLGTTTPDTQLQVIGGIKTGDDNTNYSEFSSTGDLTFTGTAGLCYGEIYCTDTSTTETITTTGKANKVQISAFAVNGVYNHCTPDHTNDHITITKAGMYLCNVSMHLVSPGAGGANNIGYSVYKNNGATEFPNLHGQRDLAGGGGDEGSISLSGIIDLAVNDTIEVWIWNNTNNDDVIVDDINLSLVQIGGT